MIKKIFLPVILSVSMLAPYAVYAENAEFKPIYCGAYYSADGKLIGTKNIVSMPTDEETEILLELYKPDEAVKAKLYKWDDEKKPAMKSVTFDLSDEAEINIIHTNDMHGSLAPSGSSIGIDKVATLKKLSDNALLFDAGDATQGVSFATLSKGEDVIKAMSMADYDGMTLGNHEFDYGIEKLKENIILAQFPVFSANTETEVLNMPEKEPLVRDSHIYPVGDYTVGVFGLTTTNTRTSTNPKNVETVTFTDEIETASSQISHLTEAGVDVVLGLVHLGVTEDVNCTSTQLATAMKDTSLDVIIDGHSHTVVTTAVDGVTIAQTGNGGANVGYVEIDINEDETVEIDATTLTKAFFDNIEADSEVSAFLDSITEKQSETTKTVIAKTDSALWGGYINNIAETRLHETNLGDLICDSMISETNEMVDDAYKSLPVVAVVNGGGIRATIPAGDITWGNVIDVLPFSNTIMYTEVTPKVIYEMLEHSVASINSQDKETGLIDAEMSGGFLQIGGMSFEYNPNGNDGNKVIAVYLDGNVKALEKTDESTKIVLASNDYIIAGGDGYDMLGNLKTLGEGRGLAEILMDYIKDTTVSCPVTNNRIRPVSEYEPKDYTAHMYVKNPDDTPLKDKEITYSIDGVENKGKTDADGILSVTVSDGPHTVSIGMESVYVNNYSGNGVIEIDGDYPITYPTLIAHK